MRIKTSLLRASIYSLVSATIAFTISCGDGTGSEGDSAKGDSTSTGSDNTLLGAGGTFVYPLFSKQFSEYNKLTGLKVNYQSIGSGGGILQITNKTVDFGESDAPLNDEQTQKIGVPMLHIPMASGAVVITYNIPGVTDTLKLVPSVLADIFLGKIKNWNDKAIASANAGVKLPATPVIVAHRSDGSGTTFIFVDFLSKVSEEWKSKVGKGTSVNWPAGLGGKGNEGVAGLVKQTPGAIGYIELAYAIQNKMSFAKVQNKSGAFITPTIQSITEASNIPLPEDAKVSITNTDAPQGYPISSLTWALIYKDQRYADRSEDKATKLVKLLWWNTHEGQQYCEPLHYAPLSKSAVTVTEKILKSANYGGRQILQ